MKKGHYFIITGAAVFVAILAGVFWLKREQIPPRLDSASAKEPEAVAVKKPRPPSVHPEGDTEPSRDNPLLGLNQESGDIEQDLQIVQHLFFQYQSLFKQNPLGTHQEIISALQGDNPRKIIYLTADNPALNESGALVDRWGTPFFFHAVSRFEMEIMSAGPDRELWTEDDAVLRGGSTTVQPSFLQEG